VSLAGDMYSYVNPLQYERGHSRWKWHGCPCCPPMFLKIMGSLAGYVYAKDERGVTVNLFIGSRADMSIQGQPVIVRQTTRYPWDGAVRLEISPAVDLECDVRVRVPAWCQQEASPDALYRLQGVPASGAFRVKINGQEQSALKIERGYAVLHRVWHKGDTVEVAMDMPVRRVHAHPAVKSCERRVALQRGPVVCAVETPSPGLRARNAFLPPDALLEVSFQPNLLGGVAVIRGGFQARGKPNSSPHPAAVEAAPYFAYGNRGEGDLRVWLPERAEDAQTN